MLGNIKLIVYLGFVLHGILAQRIIGIKIMAEVRAERCDLKSNTLTL